MFFVYCIIFFHANDPVTLAYCTSTHSYIIDFCSRIMGLKAYLDFFMSRLSFES